ncbi:MAG: DUF4361 domain-containing protein [Tannerella sp.]|jgi:hypothetical protein|nr:DUF4361 domain-containing protein [Tannerella sp.]
MKYISIVLAVILVAGFSSCNEDKIFEKEQYKTVFALVSDDGYNIFPRVHALEEDESIGYVAASCGGTVATEQDITVTMVEDRELFDHYNLMNFDMDEDRYARLLSPDKYDIDNFTLQIPAGERSGKMKIRIRPEGLSPDSVYFISLKAKSFSGYEINPAKSDLLYRVLIKNRFATQESATNYALRGIRDGVNTMGVKPMQPLGKNTVRIMAGTEAYKADIATLNQSAIILEIDEDNHVHISSYKNMVVTQVDGDPNFPNIFKIEKDDYGRFFKNFLLRYDYKIGTVTYQMSEELRLEVKENELK